MDKSFLDFLNKYNTPLIENLNNLPKEISDHIDTLNGNIEKIELAITQEKEKYSNVVKSIKADQTKEAKQFNKVLIDEEKNIKNLITEDKINYQNEIETIQNEINDLEISNKDTIKKYNEILNDNSKKIKLILDKIVEERVKAETIQNDTYLSKSTVLNDQINDIETKFNATIAEIVKELESKTKALDAKLKNLNDSYENDRQKIKEKYDAILNPLIKKIDEAKNANKKATMKDYMREQAEKEVDYRNELKEIDNIRKAAEKEIKKQLFNIKKADILKRSNIIKEKLKAVMVLENEIVELGITRDLLLNYAQTYEITETAKKEREIREFQIQNKLDHETLIIKSKLTNINKDNSIKKSKLQLDREIKVREANLKIQEIIHNANLEILECNTILKLEKAYYDYLKNIYKLRKEYKLEKIKYYEEINNIFYNNMKLELSNLEQYINKHNELVYHNEKDWLHSTSKETIKEFNKKEVELKHDFNTLIEFIDTNTKISLSNVDIRFKNDVDIITSLNNSGNLRIDKSIDEVNRNTNKSKENIDLFLTKIIDTLDNLLIVANKNNEKSVKEIIRIKEVEIKKLELEIKELNSLYLKEVEKINNIYKQEQINSEKELKDLNKIINEEKKHADKTLAAIVSYQNEINSAKEQYTNQTKEKNQETLLRDIKKEQHLIDLEAKKNISVIKND